MFCIYCGAANPEDASFCSICGKGIGAPPTPPPGTGDPQQILGNPERSSESETRQVLPPTVQPQTPCVTQNTGKAKPVLWILGGFAACLLLVIALALGSRPSQNPSGQEAARDDSVRDSAVTTPPSTPPAVDTTPAPAMETAAIPTPEPASAPAQTAPPPPATPPQNPIVGDWKATTFLGTGIGLHLGADGRYVMNPGSQEGVYVFSSGDGTLRFQSNSFFSKGIMVWSCQVSGDSLSCVDPEGAGHIYNRLK